MRYTFIVCLIWVACKSHSASDTLGLIPGTYVRAINHEFAKGYDTLIVKLLDKHTETFSIVKRAGFVQFVDGKTIGKRHTAEKFITVYNEQTGTLNDNYKMKSFLPLTDKGILMSGSISYKKVVQ